MPSIDNATFDPLAELAQIRARRADARRKILRKSRLDKYRAELILMRDAGASCADLVEWLRIKHRCKINRSSVDRYLRNVSETQSTYKSHDEQAGCPNRTERVN